MLTTSRRFSPGTHAFSAEGTPGAHGGTRPLIEVFQAHPDFLGFRVDTGELTAEVIEHGGIVTRIEVPDRRGDFANVLLGCPTIADYLGPHPHFNCLVGRYANRMTNARFELDGTLHKLDANLPPHHLHGGQAGFGLRRWTGTAEDDGVLLKLRSPDGESGYPGNLTVEARYRFTGRDMSLEFRAVTDAPTPVSLSSHHYYNLTGMAGSTIDDHEVVIDADHFLPVSAALTQLGEIRGVSGTPFDLRRTVVLRDAFRAADAQMRLADGGFDHTFVLKPGFQRTAVVRHPDSGRTLTVTTDQPGVQFYTANTLHTAGRHGRRYPQRGAFCLETQQFPDAPNHPDYPNAIVRPEAPFTARTVFSFSMG